MSNATYSSYWREASHKLQEQLEYETAKEETGKSRDSVYSQAILMYVRYIQIFKKLEQKASYDQMLHPQKRRVLKDLVISVMGRILELKQEAMKARTFAYDETLKAEYPLTRADAVRIIQMHERGRQAKLKVLYMKQLRYQGHKAREIFRKVIKNDDVFLGMKTPMIDPENNSILKAEKNRERRKVIQQMHETEYQQSLVSTKEKLYKVEGPDIKEELQDQFRQYYLEYKKANNVFPDFPEEEDFLRPDFKFGEKKKPADAASTDTKEDKKGAKKDAKKDQNEEEDISLKLEPSKFVPMIQESQKQYVEQWRDKDETNNFAQKHDQEIVKKQKRGEIELEVKKEIISLLRDELENLKIAVDKEKAKKGKGKKDKAKKGGKKDKKGKKGKKDKDLTANVPMEVLVEELVNAGIIQQYGKVELSQFKGVVNLMTASTEKVPFIPPNLGEVAKLVMEYCILPLGSPAPSDPEGDALIKVLPVMLFGAEGSGKTMLVNAIASATNALVFNISPRNTAGQYVGKAQVTKMIHTVFKVAKANAPSIIYIDGFEMIFAKKVPKTDTSDPKRIKKDLLKQMKLLASGNDRVLVIGASRKPWEGDVKTIFSMFPKILHVPKPDYLSRFLLWKNFIERQMPEDAIDCSLLARMSAGLSAGQIKNCVEETLKPRRLALVRTKPITVDDFIHNTIPMLPLNADEDTAFKEFLERTPLFKKRAEMLNPSDKAEEKKPAKKK